MKLSDYVLIRDGRPGYIAEIHAKAKSVKVVMIGMCKKPYIVTELTKHVTPISRTEAWNKAIPYI